MLGVGTLLMPQLLAGNAGRDGIFSIGLSVAAGYLYLRILRKLQQDVKGTFSAYLKEKLGVFGSGILLSGYLVCFVLLSGYVAHLSVTVMQETLLREESYWLILTFLLLLVWYGIRGGMEGRARIYEILFGLLIVPLLLMLLSAVREVQSEYWAPLLWKGGMNGSSQSVTAAGWGKIAAGAYCAFLPFGLLALVLFLADFMDRKELAYAAGRRALFLTTGICAAIYLILVGIFGVPYLASMNYPIITLMSTVQISGGFLKRTDAFMAGIWFFLLYGLLSSMVGYGGMVMADLFDRSGKRKEKRYAALLLLPVLLLSGRFYRSPAVYADCETFLYRVGIPYLLAVPVFLWLMKYAGKKIVAAAVLAVCFCTFCGCSQAELEEREFPIEIGVDTPENVAEEWLNASVRGNHVKDYNHLKVIVLSQSFLEDEQAMKEFLDLLEERNDVPRNTYVVAAESPAEVLAAVGEGSDGSLGDYVEQMFENVGEIKKNAYPTLGMLYQEQENQLETLWIPCLAPKDDTVAVDHYYGWRRGQAVAVADRAAVLLSFFTTNDMKTYTLTMEDGSYVELTSSHNKISLEVSPTVEQKGTITVDVYCVVNILAGKNQATAKEYEDMLSDYMNGTAGRLLRDTGLDAANSYKSLWSQVRTELSETVGTPESAQQIYEEQLGIEYRLHITWIS
jgi:hypothetical protein